jgi:hypothetical protein
MTRPDAVMLEAVSAALRRAPIAADPNLGEADWAALLQLAAQQEILPLVYEAVYRCPSFKALEKNVREKHQKRALQAAIRQIVQTNEFLTLLLHAQAAGLDPTVLKGAVIRQLYPFPMLRPSVDEDLLVSPREVAAYHRFFLSEGLSSDDPDADIASSEELSYHKDLSPTYIELHASAFPADSAAYGDCNALFDGALDRTVTVQIEDVTLRTLAPTDHLLYLICHAYKHFLHGGVGIRQVCDIAMLSRAYGPEIDWDHILKSCRSMSIERFTSALFRIAANHLGFDMPPVFAGFDVDEMDLLEDILSGGLYGTADVDRLHSSSMTLEAVAAAKSGKRRKGALHSVFLSAKSLAGRYPYLRRFPVLLPVAWSQRIWNYAFRKKGAQKVNPSASVRIGNSRIALLREYGIIE